MADDIRTADDDKIEIETMTEHFTCPICAEYMQNKITICRKGHSICFKCASGIGKCPYCKEVLDPRKRNFGLENAAKLFIKYDRKINEEKFIAEINMRKRIPKDQTGPYWQEACDGEVPDKAFHGGYEGSDTLYVARAEFGGGVIVGKLNPRHKTAFLPWGSRENEVFSYEVLCNFNGHWTECLHGEIPENAYAGGLAENGEPLYIGRVQHDSTNLVVGKVHPSHQVLYISYNGEEIAYGEYEILCQSELNYY